MNQRTKVFLCRSSGLALSLFFLFPAHLVHAQGVFPSLSRDQGAVFNVGVLELNVSPRHPRPNQQMTISVTNFTVDLNRSNISWYKNGTLLESGLGLKETTTGVGDVGNTNTIRVVIETPAGTVLEETLVVRPADVSLLWQADSYTPPFYLGKTLRAAEGDVTILAIPNIVENGIRQSIESLIFTWEQDGLVLGDRSGVGRNTLEASGSLLSRPIEISVEVSTLSGNTTAKRFLRIPVVLPVTRLYENNPVLGVLFNNALTDTIQLDSEETTIEAFPYFFSTRDRFLTLSHEWRVAGTRIENNNIPNITLRRGGLQGSASLSVSSENPTNILELTDSRINIGL